MSFWIGMFFCNCSDPPTLASAFELKPTDKRSLQLSDIN
jgi:hypothetical protein